MTTNIFTLIVAVLTLLTSILTLIKSWMEIKKLKENLERIQIVANPREMKEALIKPLEGLWSVSGLFEKFQGENVIHYSSGYASFLWDDSLDRYDIVYSYSVSKSHENTDCVTAICRGYALVGNSEFPRNLDLIMKIENITSAENINNPQSKDFTLKTTFETEIQKSLREMKFSFQTDITNGTIRFSR